MKFINRDISIFFFFISILLSSKVNTAFGQAPNISYPTPQIYTVNTTITTLAPINSGGAVPANIYGQVSTFAGTGHPGNTNGPVLSSTFSGPRGSAIDLNGNIYIVDDNNTIRKITPDGIVLPFAGSGAIGFANGNGSAASFAYPTSLAVDKAGNVYIGDNNNNAIRKITPAGDVSTLAGNGSIGFSNGLGSAATFHSPRGVVVDASGNVFVADNFNSSIRKITPTGEVTTFAGNGSIGANDGVGTSATFSEPTGIAIDATGNLYVADAGNNKIRKITTDGVVTTLAGNGNQGFSDGIGTSATFQFPQAVAVDAANNVYVADSFNQIIRKITPDGFVTTIAGNGIIGSINGVSTKSSFSYPYGIATNNVGDIYIADNANNLIRIISISGYSIDKPLPPGLVFDATTGKISGTPTVASPATNYIITAYNTGGSSSAIVNIQVTSNSIPLLLPPKISYQTPQTYIVSTAITTLTPTNSGGAVPANVYGQPGVLAGSGSQGNTNASGTAASFHNPIGTVTDAAGNIYVADRDNFLIRKITPAGAVTTFAGSGISGNADGQGTAASFTGPSGLATDAAGNIYVADSYGDKIRKITPGGLVTTITGSTQGENNGPIASATFNQPVGIALDAAGNIYVAEFSNYIRKISTNGIVSTLAGNGTAGMADGQGAAATFNNPQQLTVDAAGNIYVADVNNNSIRKISPTGLVSTINYNPGAQINYPEGVVIDAVGNLYISDAGNSRIDKIDPSGNFTILTAGTVSYPLGLSIDASGNLYIASFGNNSIVKVFTTGYTINKTLPSGLTFDATTGKISGTPTAPSPPTDYTVTAYNTGGSSITKVNIAVKIKPVTPIPPPIISYQTPKTYYVNATIAPLAPVNTGGSVPPGLYGQVSTFAGGGQGNANGTGTAAGFNSPYGIIADNNNNLFVSDPGNILIRKITSAGVVSNFAGSGNQGRSNGTGSAASFYSPAGMVFDYANNIYLADEGNNLIRGVTSPGAAVNTFAGTGQSGFNNGPRSQATFNYPVGVTFDQYGVLYISELSNNVIREITPTGDVSTFAGSGATGLVNGNGTAAQFANPQGLAADATGNLFVADAGNEVVRKINASGTVSTLAITGQPGPYAITVGNNGNIYAGDEYGIWEITPSGGISMFAGIAGTTGAVNGPKLSATFNRIFGLTFDTNGDLFVADSKNNLIRKIDLTGYTIDKPLPAGLVFDPKTGIISGTPTVISPPTNYTVTAYNAGGSYPFTLNIQVISGLTFNPIPDKTVCDIDFDPGAVSPSGSVSYTSSNIAVATIVANKIHITGAGTTVITATDGALTVTQNLTVTPAVTPSVSISPTTVNECQGTPVTFTATPTNGGTNPLYQWDVNGAESGTGPTFISSTLNNGDIVSCILTSNAICTTSATAQSNLIKVVISQPTTTTVTITPSPSGLICAGTPVTFTARPNLSTGFATSGDNPVYQWQVNGNDAGINSSTFTSNSLANGDVVTCIFTSNEICVINPQAISNPVAIVFNPASVCDIIIPNTFTPNGDGINDLWNISALQNFPECTVKIYTRNGGLIYNSVGYSKAWDGTYNGSNLPVGVYYYVIDLRNGTKPMAGSITLLR